MPFSQLDLPEQLLLSAILAAGARPVGQPDSCHAGRIYASYAESLALTCCKDSPSLNVIRALSIMSWYEISLDRVNTGWLYNSMAAALAVHLGLHCLTPRVLTPQSVGPRSTVRGSARMRWRSCR
jgi:hypothetical protein